MSDQPVFTAPSNGAPPAPSAPKAPAFVSPPAESVPVQAQPQAFTFTPPQEAPRPPPDPTLGMPGGAVAVAQPVFTRPVDTSGVVVASAAPVQAPVPPVAQAASVAAPSQPAPAATPSGLTPEQKAARAKAIADAAAKNKGKRRLKLEDTPSEAAVSAPAPAVSALGSLPGIGAVEAQWDSPPPTAEVTALKGDVKEVVPTGQASGQMLAAPEPAVQTGDDLLDHPDVRAAKKRIAAEKNGEKDEAGKKLTASGKIDKRTLSKSARARLEAKEKRQARRLARKEKKEAALQAKRDRKAAKRAKKLAAKEAEKVARREKREAKRAKKEAALAAKPKRGPGRPPGSGKKRGPGRPPKARGSAQGHSMGGAIIFTVRVSEAQAKEAKAAAAAADLKLSEWIRKKLGL